jgi:hypothetical protein
MCECVKKGWLVVLSLVDFQRFAQLISTKKLSFHVVVEVDRSTPTIRLPFGRAIEWSKIKKKINRKMNNCLVWSKIVSRTGQG